MDNQITIEKLYEMYGKVSLERDLMREQIQQMQQAQESQAMPKREDKNAK